MLDSASSKVRAGPQPVALLPFDLIDHIAVHLTAADKAALVLTHPIFTAYFRCIRSKCLARVENARQLKQLSCSLEKQTSLSHVHCRLLYNKPSLRDLRYLNPTTQSLTLAFLGTHPKKTALSAMGAAEQFAHLTALTLEGSNEKTGWLNLDGSLSALSTMQNLQELKLVRLGTDRGLQHLTQIRSLEIVYPNHDGPDAPENPICPGCNQIHLENLEEYFDEVTATSSVQIGPYIRLLPQLTHLYLDFAADGDVMNHSALRNFFDWGPDGHGACFPSLTTVEIVNAGKVTSYLLDEADLDQFFFSGNATWLPSLVIGAFSAMPALQQWNVASDIKGAAGSEEKEARVNSILSNNTSYLHMQLCEEGDATLFNFKRVSGAEAAKITETLRASHSVEL